MPCSLFICSLSLLVSSFLLLKNSNLDPKVHIPLGREGVTLNGRLEVVDGIVNLVGPGKDVAKSCKYLRFLVEVGAHLENSEERRDSMFVRLKLFVEDANAVPQLRVHDVVEVVESILVCLERLLKILF